MKKVLVTGGAGFIGSHLIEELLQEKNLHVISLDNYSTGTAKNHIDGVEYIKGDTKNITSYIKTTPEIVYHLGEYSRTSVSFSEPEKVWDFNIAGTLAVLEFCRNRKCKIVYAGSSTKFGDAGKGSTQSPYAWSKATNTDLVQRYGEWFGLEYAITYFYNVYGEREMDEGAYASLIGIFFKQHVKNDALTLVSPGTQRRDFTYVKDIVRGVKLVGEKGNGDGYCLGSGKSYTIREVAQMFGDTIHMVPERLGDRQESSIDLEKSHALGWKATVSLAEYIENKILKNV